MWQFIAEANAQGLMALTAPATTQAPLSDPSIGTQHRHSPLGHSTARRPGPSSLPPSHDGKERNPPPPLFSPRRLFRPPLLVHPDRQTVHLSRPFVLPPYCASALSSCSYTGPSLPPSLPTLESRYSRARSRALSINQPERQTDTHTPFAVLPRVCTQASPAVAVRRGVSRCLHVPSHKRRACVRAYVHTYINALLQGR